MKLEINLKKLKESIYLIDRIASKHQTLPVLSCILLNIKDNNITFKSTNLDVGVEIDIPVKSSGEWSVAIPSSTLSAFLNQIHDDNQIIKIEAVSENIHIQTNKSKGIIKTLPTDDFPDIPRVQNGKQSTISPKYIVDGLSAVSYSASISTVKPELSSVYIYKNIDDLVFVATDSFRLAEKKIRVDKSVKIDDILIPFKNVQDIVKILQNFSKDIILSTSKNLISFECDGVYIVSRVIDGVFPDYKQIIPKSFSTEVVSLKQDILDALKISNIFSDKFNQIHLTIDPKNKLFELQTKNSDIGENQTNIDSSLSGDKIEVNFNYKYIYDGFQSIYSDSVSLQFNGLNKPVIIKPVSGDQTFLYLVMPMNR